MRLALYRSQDLRKRPEFRPDWANIQDVCVIPGFAAWVARLVQRPPFDNAALGVVDAVLHDESLRVDALHLGSELGQL